MVRAGARPASKPRGGFSASDSRFSSDDRYTLISAAGFALWPWATAGNSIAQTPHITSRPAGVRFEFMPSSLRSGIRFGRRRGGRRLRQVRVLLYFVALQRFLRAFRLLVFQLLKRGHGSLRFLGPAQPPVNDTELIPGLLDDVGIGSGRRRGPLQVLRGGGVVAEQHFGAAQIVIDVKE